MYLYEYTAAYEEIGIFMLLINTLISFRLFKTESFGNEEKALIKIITAGSLCIISDVLCIAGIRTTGPELFYILNAAFYITYSCAAFMVFLYTFRLCFGQRFNRKLISIVSFIPFLIVIIISIMSFWTGWAFTVDENSLYHRGEYFSIYYTFGISYIVFTIALAVYYCIVQSKKTKHYLHAILFVVPLFCGPVMQSIFPQVPATGMGFTLSFLCLFMNNQEIIINKSSSSIKMIAALGSEYEAVHVADLDNNLFDTIRASSGMKSAGIEEGELPYDVAVRKFVDAFVMPVTKDEFIEFLDADLMKERMEEQNEFSYRYAIKSNYNGRYIYEMRFVKVDDNPDRHVVAIGTKCIDEALKMERVQAQYNEALLHDCAFFYEFDVTEGELVNRFHITENYNPLFDLDIEFPILYDDFNTLRSLKLGLIAASDVEASYWTCKGLMDAFGKGKRSVEIRYSSEKLMLSWTATIILSEDPISHHIHAVYICKDVTELIEEEKRHQLELEKALVDARNANASKADFLACMSHDIRTPLNGIIGLININEKHKDDRELVDANRQKAKVAADHLLNLVNDILDVNKLEDSSADVTEPFNVYEVCSEVLTICGINCRENGLTCTHDYGQGIKHPFVFGNSLHFRRILMNIVSNAIKFNKLNGSVHAATRVISFDGETVVYEFLVRDTGIGMSREFLDHIYEPFSQEIKDSRSRFHGTGMGMTIVKSLLDKMHGSIRIETEQGKGTSVFITVPFKIDRNEFSKKKADISGEVSINGLKVLVVEDNDLNQEIAKTIIEDAGGVVTIANDGLEACEIFEARSADSFDVILMDIMMPRLDGYSATKRIRESGKKDALTIPIIAMTANVFADDVQKTRVSGMNEHLSKPLDTEKLLKTLSLYKKK